ncbi:hypothetical protein C6P45_003018 [Maudiozyma exigua]|uniref:GATA-type domain-containing protein n=1 Tax=Maudiozyma exigua TaxID=34358 RepID=A0A9P7BD77_MAUEX|nr:hypothetical protein C6P45_003018 [Kazachstania exigua]
MTDKDNNVKREDEQFYSLFDNDHNFDNYLNFSQENNNNNNNNNTNTAGTNAGGFDSMLEVLPDDITFNSFFTPLPTDEEDDNLSMISDRSKNNNNQRMGHQLATVDENLQIRNHTPRSPSLKYESIFNQMSSQQSDANANNTTTTTQPIDINNQQNGEIAGLWDFNVDTLQMTPGNSSDSATISAPNSYNSTGLGMLATSNNSHSNGNSFNQFKNLTSNTLTGQNNNNNNKFNNGTTLFQQNIPSTSYSNSNMNSIFNQNNNNNNVNNPNNQTNSFNIYNIPSNSNTNSNGNVPNYSSSPMTITPTTNQQSIFRRNSRKSSMSQISTNLINTDKGVSIPLNSTNTNNSIRKNQMARQLSSTSLTNLNKRTSSISDLSTSGNNSSILSTRKPPVQCFNCKTYKTPLWRRDPNGRTLCNACGLFQKLHGTMRPLSLKSDVIKKRNTKKRTKKALAEQAQAQQQQQQQQQPTVITEGKQSNIRRNFVPPSISNATATTAMTRAAAQSNLTNARNRGSFTNVSVSAGGPSPSYNNMRPSDDMHSNQLGSTNRGNKVAISPVGNDIAQFNGSNNNGTMNRRGSTSSNTSSRSSSSRSMIPILPKPASNTGMNIYSTSNNNNGNLGGNISNGSSPRVISNGYPFMSNSPIQSGLFSSSVGQNGISIPRRKTSRNASRSSSFMAASLQQLQQQGMKQPQQQQQDTTRMAGSAITPSPMRDEYDMFARNNNRSIFQRDNDNSQFSMNNGQPVPYQNKQDRSHTSLLSQQLSDSSINTLKNDEPSKNKNNSNSNNNTQGENNNDKSVVATSELDWLKFGI